MAGQMDGQKISVIVPVYKVEQYLDECVRSIVGQTYKNLDIILVDDGSTDASGGMCDAWAQRDARVRVIHKANGGLSDARNAGIEAAVGDYFCFVDSDDWIDLSMLEVLYAAVRDSGADMAFCGWQDVYEDRVETHCPPAACSVTGEEAVRAAIDDRFPFSRAYCWNRLYARRIWDAMRFPVGRVFEDVWVRSEIYARCAKIAVVDRALYFYRRREGSISFRFSVQDHLDIIEAVLHDCENMHRRYPHLSARIRAFAVGEILDKYGWLADREIPRPVRAWFKERFRQNRKGAWRYLPLKRKIRYAMFMVSPEWMLWTIRLYAPLMAAVRRATASRPSAAR